MVAYGICQSTACSLSYLNPALDAFRRRVHTQQAIAGSETHSAPQLSNWEDFEKFFQRGTVCSACGKPLYLATQPSEGIDAEEYKRRVKLNAIVEVAGQLQAWGLLRG